MRDMVVWVPDWPVHCLVVDLPPGGVGAVVYADRIEVASAAARRVGVRSGMSVREATFYAPTSSVCLAIPIARPGHLARLLTPSTQ